MGRLTKVDGIGQNEIIKCFDCDLEKAGTELEHCGYCEHWQAVVDRLAAGRLVIGVAYTTATLQDSPKERSERVRLSSAARTAINLKHSWQKLEVVIAANYTKQDLFVTLTYDDAHIPASRTEAVKCLKRWIARLRVQRRRQGQPLTYIYVTEQFSSAERRIHHHLIINGTGDDYETVRSLWDYGNDVEIRPLAVGGYDDSYAELAKYMTKEPRKFGKAEIGVRTWTTSMGLIHPKPETTIIKDNETITAPPGAFTLQAPMPSRNIYGEYTYIKYLLPEPRQAGPYTRPPRNNSRISLSDLKPCITSGERV